MYEYKCKGCLIDSTHGKLQKKKEVLLEFLFAENSLCLTVSAQNVNIHTYTLNKETISTLIATNDLLMINFKVKNQIKISSIGKNKLNQLKTILDALLNENSNVYETNVEIFCQMSNDISHHSKSKNSSISSEKSTTKIDRNENDENSQSKKTNVSNSTEKKKNALHSTSNFYPNSHQDDHSTDEVIAQTQSSRKRTNESQSSIRYEHATSPYFYQRTTNKFQRNSSNGESRSSPLANIHSKPISRNLRLWDIDDKNDRWNEFLPIRKKNDETGLIRKKGLKNLGATCYMNSILQCLLNIDPFRYDLLVTNKELIMSNLLSENTIYFCVLEILSILQDRQSQQSQQNSTTQFTDDERTVESLALNHLKKVVEKHSEHFFGSRQQDSHEFLNLIISMLTDEIDAIQTEMNEQTFFFSSEIVDPTRKNFQFCLATERSCQICERSTTTTEIHTSLLIHVTDEQKRKNCFTELLENYFQTEIMDGCFCEDCRSNQRKSIKYQLERLPRVFIFYFKRWHIKKNEYGELESVSKEDHPIQCPIDINMMSFCSSTVLQPEMIEELEHFPNGKDLLQQREEILRSNFDGIESKRARIELKKIQLENRLALHADYRLFAVINHHGGSSDVGHYTSTVYDSKAKTWWTYDDTSVSLSTEEQVLTNLAPDAYGVMYMHKDILKLFQSNNETLRN